MKKQLVSLAMLVALPLAMSASAEFPIEAKTSDGKIVVLHEDGTWRPKTLQLDHRILRKSDFATRQLKSRLKFYEFWVDSKLWKDIQAEGAYEYSFEHQSGEAWCGIIPERIQVTRAGLVKGAVSNLHQVDPNGKLEQRSKAYVNGLGGEVVELSGTSDEFLISYHTFLWSGDKGTVQIACRTSRNILDEYRPVFSDFIGGFMLVE